MELHALTGQLYIIEGVAQDNSDVPGLVAQLAPSGAAHGRKGEVLFVHLTLTGGIPETANLLRGEVTRIAEQYFQSVGSVTAALRKVIQDTNNRLLQLNLSGQGQPREGAITCAVQRGSELFIVQTGESLALVGHNFGVERMPGHRPDHITPLGRSAGIDFRYYQERLQPGDMLLLADPRISHLPSHALAPALVDTELEMGLEELSSAVGTDSGRLLLAEFTDEPLGATAVVTRPVMKRGRITLPLSRASRQAAQEQPMPAQPLREPVRSGTLPPPVPPPLAQPPAPATSKPIEAPLPEAPVVMEPSDIAQSVEYTTRQAAATSAAGLSQATGWMAEAMLRVRPPGKEAPADGSSWALPALLAIVIPVIVAVIVSSVYLQRGRVQQVGQLRQTMSAKLVQAQEAAGDPEMARARYGELLVLAEQAEALRPGDPGVAEMRRQGMLALDELDGIARLSARPFYSFTNDTALSTVTLRDDFVGGIFLLDSAGGTVYALDTDEAYTEVRSTEPQPVAFNGQAVGNHVVANLVDLVWRPKGVQVTRDGLLILDAGGATLAYYPGTDELESTPLGLSSEWQNAAAETLFSERLYVLDPASEAIWKYFPQADGYEVSAGERTLQLDANADLRSAIDIDLYGEDGSLLIAYADGRLRYYDTRSGRVVWDETDLLANGLSAPLVNPVAAKIVGRGLNASIFVLDAANGRVIQISRLGNVLAQFRATDGQGLDVFTGGTDLAVAETPLRIFVTRGNQLFQATQ